LYWWFPDEEIPGIVESCASELSQEQMTALEAMDSGGKVLWLESNCVAARSTVRARAWDTYSKCKPGLTPEQTEQFETSSWGIACEP